MSRPAPHFLQESVFPGSCAVGAEYVTSFLSVQDSAQNLRFKPVSGETVASATVSPPHLYTLSGIIYDTKVVLPTNPATPLQLAGVCVCVCVCVVVGVGGG